MGQDNQEVMSMPKKQNAGRPRKTAAASLMETDDPNTRAYLGAYATPEAIANFQQLRFAQPHPPRTPEAQLQPSVPSDRTGSNSFLPMGSSYPVSLHVLLDADPAARAYLDRQPPDIRQAVMAANLQTAGELENYVKKLENRLDGRPPDHNSPENGHA